MSETTMYINNESETDRPDWVHCIKSDRIYYGLCGRFCGWEFMFESPEHAKLSVEHGSRLVPCDECLESAEDIES